jgi:GNAT superfamily N-acetyltransferase
MYIRKATDRDDDQIIDILKLSLGEMSSPKSLGIWKWKHGKNPFGSSEVLVAETEGALAGVRAMMPWIWQEGNKQYKAYRAVDTAVHPKHQGKGLFTKLTRQVLIDLEMEGATFIFNTPNQQSLPGYVKMGWKKWGRVPVHFYPSLAIKKTSSFDFELMDDFSSLNDLCQHWNQLLSSLGKLFTPKSQDYLEWRYKDNPIIDYVIHAEKDIFIAGYIKKRKYFNELRICEWMADPGLKCNKKIFSAFVQKIKSHNKVDVITLSEANAWLFGLPGLNLPVGPVLTIKNLQSEVKIPGLGAWSPALGDLELM